MFPPAGPLPPPPPPPTAATNPYPEVEVPVYVPDEVIVSSVPEIEFVTAFAVCVIVI